MRLTILEQVAEPVTSADKDAMQDAYGAELYNADWVSYFGREQLAFFETSRGGTQRGLVVIDLDTFVVTPIL